MLQKSLKLPLTWATLVNKIPLNTRISKNFCLEFLDPIKASDTLVALLILVSGDCLATTYKATCSMSHALRSRWSTKRIVGTKACGPNDKCLAPVLHDKQFVVHLRNAFL